MEAVARHSAGKSYCSVKMARAEGQPPGINARLSKLEVLYSQPFTGYYTVSPVPFCPGEVSEDWVLQAQSVCWARSVSTLGHSIKVSSHKVSNTSLRSHSYRESVMVPSHPR